MKKQIALLMFLFGSFAYGCAMCQMSVPQVSVYTKIYDKNDHTAFDVTWKFHKAFTALLNPYDKDGNGIFDPEEKVALLQSIVVYIQPLNYLTEVQYVKKDSEFENKYLKPTITKKGSVSFKNGALVFQYSFTLPVVLQKDHKLSLSYFDNGGNFYFTFSDTLLKEHKGFFVMTPTYYRTYIYFFKNIHDQKEQIEAREEIGDAAGFDSNDTLTPPAIPVSTQTQRTANDPSTKSFSPIAVLRTQLNELKDRLKATLQEIKKSDSLLSYFWLLLFSFLYGVLHAIGPGHGKSLVSSYFMQKEGSYLKAFSIASLIGVVHTFSAFLLTMVVYFLLGLMFSSSLINIEQATTKVSAVIIILIALYLIYGKYKRDRKPKEPKKRFIVGGTSPMIQQHASHQHNATSSCGCSACKTTSTDLGVILAAGIVPCPGTVTIFLFTLSLGVYVVGFLSAIFMSLGMSLIIYITAITTIKIRKKSAANTKLIKFLEYGSLTFILFLGIILLLL